jgi:hypothetical protein
MPDPVIGHFFVWPVLAPSRAGSLLQGNAIQNVGVSLLAMAIKSVPQNHQAQKSPRTSLSGGFLFVSEG